MNDDDGRLLSFKLTCVFNISCNRKYYIVKPKLILREPSCVVIICIFKRVVKLIGTLNTERHLFLNHSVISISCYFTSY